MITNFDKYLNENLTQYKDIPNEDLVEELKDAKYIEVDHVGGKYWGVRYIKNGQTYMAGKFLMNEDVHEFLIANNIDYRTKEGYMSMRKFRADKKKIPYSSYQRDLIEKGIDDM
jgi:hypothetical protein